MSVNVVGRNEIRVKMILHATKINLTVNFLCLLTLLIHDPSMLFMLFFFITAPGRVSEDESNNDILLTLCSHELLISSLCTLGLGCLWSSTHKMQLRESIQDEFQCF